MQPGKTIGRGAASNRRVEGAPSRRMARGFFLAHSRARSGATLGVNRKAFYPYYPPRGGVLERAVGTAGGLVKIQKENGRFQGERTYPGSLDPQRSKG